MTPELDPAGWWPDRDTHDVPRARAPYRVRFLRRKADRRRLRAVLLQAALLSIVCGGVTVLYAGGEKYADHRYDGKSTWGPKHCFITEPPPGVRRCRGIEWSEVKP